MGSVAAAGGAPPPTPSYSVGWSGSNNVNEGDNQQFNVGGTNIPNDTYYWTIETNAGDFATTSGTVSVTSNSGTFTVTPTADTTTEGAETFTVALRSGSITGTILATSTAVTINDTSVTPTPTYSIVPDTITIDEGGTIGLQTVTYAITTTNVANGTRLYWTNSGTTNAADIGGSNSGYVDISGDSASLSLTATADATTETSETIIIELRTVSVSGTIVATADTVTVGDTSLTPTYTVTPALSQTSVDEGSGITFEVGGTNIVDGTYYWTIETNAGDFATASGALTMTSNAGTFLVTPRADTTTEGEETFTVAVRSGSVSGTILVTSDPVTINDTSLTAPTYTLTPAADNVNEGSSLEFTVGGTNIIDGTYYWTVTNSGDFGTASGEFSITSNSGSFSVTPSADFTTEGSETFTASIRSVSITGTVLQTSTSVTINDTSVPVAPFSLEFVNSENDYVDVAQPSYTVSGSEGGGVSSGGVSSGNIFKGSYPQPQVGWIIVGQQMSPRPPYQVTITGVTDGGTTWNLTWAVKEADNLYRGGGWSLYDPALAPFNLSTTWTIEFWLKANAKSETASGGIWGLVNQGGWSYTDSVVVALSDNKLVFLSVANSANNDVRYVEPTPGVWTHVAISNNAGTQKVFYNGAEQTRVSGNVGTASYTNSVNPLRIGRLGPTNGGTLNGKMALVRISDTAKYATAFTPVTTYGVEADTRLFLGTDTPLVGLSTYELNGVSIVADGGGTIYFAKSAYPDLNNLIQVGYNVVGGTPTTTSTVTGAVFTPDGDPDNWGLPISAAFTALSTVNFTGTRSEPVTNSGTALTNDVPTTFAPLSLQLVQSQTDYLDVAASADWNLSRNWTIEYWSNAAKASGESDLLTVMCQDYTDGNGIQIIYIGGSFQIQGGPRIAAEPTPNQWTHVALVAVEGVMTLYYNGVSQYTGGYWSLNNTTNAIRIGARGTADFQRFDGKLAMIRISNTNKYPTAFAPTTTYGVEADTKLFLGKAAPLIDAKGHITTNNGVSTSTGFPQSFTGHLNPYSGGNLGSTYSLSGDPNITAFAAIPVGARITSNLSGFGIRLVTGNRAIPAGQLIEYDYTGLDQGLASTTSDTYNFYW